MKKAACLAATRPGSARHMGLLPHANPAWMQGFWGDSGPGFAWAGHRSGFTVTAGPM